MAPLRRSLTRVFGALTLLAVLACIGVGGYGWLRMPSSPIWPDARGYADRAGNRYSEAEYARYQLWKHTLFSCFGAAVGLGFVYGVLAGPRRDRRLDPAEAEALRRALGYVDRVAPDVADAVRARLDPPPSRDTPGS